MNTNNNALHEHDDKIDLHHPNVPWLPGIERAPGYIMPMSPFFLPSIRDTGLHLNLSSSSSAVNGAVLQSFRLLL